MAAIVLVPDVGTLLATSTASAQPVFDSLAPVAFIVAGIAIAAIVLAAVVGAIIGAVLTMARRKRKGGRRRR